MTGYTQSDPPATPLQESPATDAFSVPSSHDGQAHASRSASPHPDAEQLRRCAWDIAERRAADSYVPPGNHVGLAMSSPTRAFAHWRMLHDWIEQMRNQRGDAWNGCRMVLRLYDVSYIEFTGLNAHRIHDHPLDTICGHVFVTLPSPGTWQLAEVGFILRSGEFLPAARSHAIGFGRTSPSPHRSQTALLVDPQLRQEEISNLWDQESVLNDRRAPKLRHPLRVALASLSAVDAQGRETIPGFVAELAARLAQCGHEVHLFLGIVEALAQPCACPQLQVHLLDVRREGLPVQLAESFGRAVRRRLRELPAPDFLHGHEWMASLGPWPEELPILCSLTSLEATRRNGAPASDLSLRIAEAERTALRAARLILVPGWLREKAVADLGVAPGRVQVLAMEGRADIPHESAIDPGEVKREIHFGPLDRLILFVGPLEHAAGPDLLLEALPILLQRCGNLRVALVGSGDQYGHLEWRIRDLGLGHAVRLLGHVEGSQLVRLLHAAEAVVLPSRYRVPLDDAVVEMARRAARPVVTTHAGPAHLVRHEETGLVTYDNPGSMVWAVDRILGDPAHARQMGRAGSDPSGWTPDWSDVARHYLHLIATCLPELTETRGLIPSLHDR